MMESRTTGRTPDLESGNSGSNPLSPAINQIASTKDLPKDVEMVLYARPFFSPNVPNDDSDSERYALKVSIEAFEKKFKKSPKRIYVLDGKIFIVKEDK